MGAALGLTAMLFSSTNVSAQTPTDKIIECFDKAGDALVECVELNAWYWAWPCTWRFEADVILCLPATVISIAK